MAVVGSSGQEFTIGYEYDLWGNVNSLQMPLWERGCRGPDDWTATLFTHDAPRLIAVAEYRGTDVIKQGTAHKGTIPEQERK